MLDRVHNTSVMSWESKTLKLGLTYFGRVLWRNSWEKAIVLGRVWGKREPDRQRRCWLDTIKADTSQNMHQLQEAVQDWKTGKDHLTQRITKSRARLKGSNHQLPRQMTKGSDAWKHHGASLAGRGGAPGHFHGAPSTKKGYSMMHTTRGTLNSRIVELKVELPNCQPLTLRENCSPTNAKREQASFCPRF